MTSPVPAAAPEATLLLVDDIADNLSLLGDLLQPYYRIRAVNSGERALRAARTAPRPDLILLDVMMPEMDGYEVMRRLRADEATADIPVIFITALSDEEDELQGFELGAADYIHKPIKGAIVLSRVRAQLDARAAREMLRKHNQRLAHQIEAGAHALEQAQLQLLQSEKLAAMGQLAAGVAHEINNPVGFIGSNLNTLESYLRDIFALLDACEEAESEGDHAAVRALRHEVNFADLRQDIVALLAESREGIERVRRIAQDMKDFSRIGSMDWQFVDLQQGLESTLNIVWHQLKYHCTLDKRYGVLPKVRCLPSQLNQVFMNILVNAGQAIEGTGTITLSTACLDENTVSVSISDTGKGIEPAALERVFEPFYTTKPVGQGTGLGLSLAKEIIERHQGRIEVASTPGQGTTFTVILPVNSNPAAASDLSA